MEPVNPIYDIEQYGYNEYLATKRRVMHYYNFITITTYKQKTEIAFIAIQVIQRRGNFFKKLCCEINRDSLLDLIDGNINLSLQNVNDFISNANLFAIENRRLRISNDQRKYLEFKLQPKQISQEKISQYKLYRRELSNIRGSDKNLDLLKQILQNQRKLEIIHQDLQGQIYQLDKKIGEIAKRERIQKVEQISQNQIIDPISAYKQKFSINGFRVQFKKQDGSYYQILGSKLISQKRINNFTIQKTKVGNFDIGIFSRDYIFDKDSSQKNHCIYYVVWNGCLRVGGKWQGKQIKSKQGETIVMTVNGSTITWKVGNQVRQSFSHKMIADSSIPWVPYIAMVNQGDAIRWQ